MTNNKKNKQETTFLKSITKRSPKDQTDILISREKQF